MKRKKVFISYAKEDSNIAKKLYSDLKKAGVIPWLDTENLLPGQTWEPEIYKKIEESDFVLILLSMESILKKGFVQKEIKESLDILDKLPSNEIYIIPVRVDNCKPIDKRINGLHMVDLFPSYDEGLQKLIGSFQNGQQLSAEKKHKKYSISHFEKEDTIEELHPFQFEKQIYESLSPLIINILLQLWYLNSNERSQDMSLQSILKRKSFSTREVILGSSLFIIHFYIPLGDYLIKYLSFLISSESKKIDISNVLISLVEKIDLNEVNVYIDEQNEKFLKRLLKANIPVSFFQSNDTADINLLDQIIFHLSELFIDIYRIIIRFNQNRFETLSIETSDYFATFKTHITNLSSNLDNIKTNQTSNLESKYLDVIDRLYNQVEILGIELPVESRTYPLDLVYVPLPMKPIHSKNNNTRNETIENIIENNRIIIQAEAGFGKSTLIQWLAVLSCKRNFTKEKLSLKNRIPFIINLRNYSKQNFPSYRDYPIITTHDKIDISHEEQQRWIRTDVLQKGRGMVMFDGMDEIENDKRDEIVKRIEFLCDEFPDNIYIVTSRPAGINNLHFNRFRNIDFHLYEIEPLRFSSTCRLINKWHTAVSQKMYSDSDKLNSEAKLLIEQIAERMSLRDLAVNPLLCSVLCALNLNTHYPLPEERIAIYDKSCKMLLHERDLKKGINEKIKKTIFTYEEKIVFMKHVAETMTNLELTSIEKDIFLTCLQDKINHIPRAINNNIKDTDLKNYFLERSGMIRLNNDQKLEFVHKTFQEYLAAKAFTGLGAIGLKKLIKEAGNPFWNVVIELSAGFLNKEGGEKLVEEILKKSEREVNSNQKVFLDILAIRCFNFLTEVNRNLQKKIEDKIQRYIPPKDDNEIKMIAESKELVLPLLKKEKNRTIFEDINCIKTLIKINTYESYFMLQAYFFEKRPDYQPLLLNILSDEIDGEMVLNSGILEAYEEKCLEQNLSDNSKDILCILQEAIEKYKISIKPNIEELNLEKWIKNISFLSSLRFLETLDLSNTLVEDLSPLCKLNELRSLDISFTNVKNIKPLSDSETIQILALNGIQIEDLSPLLLMKGLKVVQLSKNSDPIIIKELEKKKIKVNSTSNTL